ncbi:SEC-C domain-containing protein [Vibrio kyushuensis]|uniref:YchJ family metal-binding protein n=1 Tax=Vibrio kyushuensis TaxID=2910249 RepID=UPI003D0DA85C
MSVCPCDSSLSYQTCCKPIHQNHSLAKRPEQLMRARYSAHVLKLVDFVIATYHSSCLAEESRAAITESIHSDWCKLEVINTQDGKDENEGFVSFKAYFNDEGQQYCMQEKSRFLKHDDLWYYIDGVMVEQEEVLSTAKIGRNDPCPCGSGKKFKKCCS